MLGLCPERARKGASAMKKYASMLLVLLLLLSAQSALANSPSLDGGTDLQKLLAFRFDGYEAMSVSEFQSRAWALADRPQYRDALNRLTQSEALYERRDSDEAAAFLFYVLEPLTAERWKTRSYSGCAVSDFPAPQENASLEYEFTLTVLNAGALNVGEYSAARLGVAQGMGALLKHRTQAQLREESAMRAFLDVEIKALTLRWQTEGLGIAIEYAYFPLSPQSEPATRPAEEPEKRRYPNAGAADYRSLLALKTPDYERQTLAAFNSALLAWADEDYERMERVGEDTAYNDFQVALPDDALAFVRETVVLSGAENAALVRSLYTGRPEEDPVFHESLPQKTAEAHGSAAWCSLSYPFSYHIADKEAVTVGERDRQIAGLKNAVRAYWEDTDIEVLLQTDEEALWAALQTLAGAYSTDHVRITIGSDALHFERADERNIN